MGRNERAVRAELRARGLSVQGSGLAAAAVSAARLLDGDLEPREVAALIRELRGTLVELRRESPAVSERDLRDELAARRRERGAGSG